MNRGNIFDEKPGYVPPASPRFPTLAEAERRRRDRNEMIIGRTLLAVFVISALDLLFWGHSWAIVTAIGGGVGFIAACCHYGAARDPNRRQS